MNTSKMTKKNKNESSSDDNYATKLFIIFGSSHRLSVVRELFACENSTTMLLDKLQISKYLLSKHLKLMLEVGIVESRTEGKEKFYRLNEQYIQSRKSKTLNLPCCNIELK
jgi:DNA-binding transcriptional ArsR family regulator